MKILCLYNNSCAIELFDWIHQQKHETVLKTGKLDAEWCRGQEFELTVSYTYRYILSDDELNALGNNVVNLHNSYLPWNRGVDPNIWSILEGTPRGVSLHYMDAQLDKGDIICQKFVPLKEGDTLQSSYNALDSAAKELFQECFLYYPFWNGMRKKAVGNGSYHSLQDRRNYENILKSYEIRADWFHESAASILRGGVFQKSNS